MIGSQNNDQSECARCEHYRRQYERNRQANLRNSSHEVAQRRSYRARRKRYVKYFLLVVLAFVAAGVLAFGLFMAFGSAQLQPI